MREARDYISASCFRCFTATLLVSAILSTSVLAAETPARFQSQLPNCGSIYAPPFAARSDAGRRPCPTPVARNYTPINHGIGFDILVLESEACFVPDESLRLLDEVVATVLQCIPKGNGSDATAEYVLSISRATSDVLADKGFGLYIPTETLGDALYFRNVSTEPPPSYLRL